MLKDKVRQALINGNMLNGGTRVTAALSGGADSTALLCALYSLREELGFKLFACHVNHNIRGEESDSDERFVRRLCRRLDIPLYVRNIRVPDLVKKHESIEQCARRIRYEFFDEAAQGGLIVTAHNAGDNAETVLINMIRGTALSGLCGIPPVRDGIIRPLIYCTRAEIEDYCHENGIAYVTDSTNLSDDYMRNRVRHYIMPQLRMMNPSFETAMSRLCGLLAADDAYLDETAKTALENAAAKGGYKTEELSRLDDSILRRAAAMILKNGDIPVNSRAVDATVQIIRQKKGKINPCQYKFVRVRKKLVFVETDYEKYRKNQANT